MWAVFKWLKMAQSMSPFPRQFRKTILLHDQTSMVPETHSCTLLYTPAPDAVGGKIILIRTNRFYYTIKQSCCMTRQFRKTILNTILHPMPLTTRPDNPETQSRYTTQTFSQTLRNTILHPMPLVARPDNPETQSRYTIRTIPQDKTAA
jgi:hypothetical protein